MTRLNSMNTNDRIKAAMRQRERDVLQLVRQCERDGEGYHPFLCNTAWSNAIDRLGASGRLVSKHGRNGRWYGYVRPGVRIVRGRIVAPST